LGFVTSTEPTKINKVVVGMPTLQFYNSLFELNIGFLGHGVHYIPAYERVKY